MEELLEYIERLENNKYFWSKKEELDLDNVLENLFRLKRYAEAEYEQEQD